MARFGLVVGLAAALVVLFTAGSASAVSPDIVISQVYGGGGDSGATFTNDYVELFNRGTTQVDVSDWSVQYASSSASSWQVTSLTGSIAPGQHYLVEEAAGTGGTTRLPTPDATGQISMSASAGKVALVASTTALAGSCPAGLRDLVGYGTGTNCFETAPTAALSNTTAAIRGANGCTETDDNSADFSVAAPSPRNSAAPATVCGPPVEIHQIQGAGHISPLVGHAVAVEGIVTVKGSTGFSAGFYLQDPTPDGHDETSEAIFVVTSTAVSVGDRVSVRGTVTESRPASTNLAATRLIASSVDVVSSGNPLPAATVIGAGGRTPPATVIEDDATGDVETSGVFDPATDGIDFYESLESMRVVVSGAVVTGPPAFRINEISVLPDDGAGFGVRTSRGGIVVRASDFNPERIILGVWNPSVNTGDHFTAPVAGVLDYSRGNFKLLPGAVPTPVPGGLTRETTSPQGAGELAIATLNVDNLDPEFDETRFDDLADVVVSNLRSPDVLALQEVQDNNGPFGGGIVDATTTYTMLIDAIEAAGGPTYRFRQIDPVDGQDGGDYDELGGNIRVGFLFRTDRGLAFVDRGAAGPTTPNSVLPGGGLAFSPGRIDPANAAFVGSRKPLAGEFTFDGVTLYLVANHFDSKVVNHFYAELGDDPLFGRFQPPTRVTEARRNQQAQIVNDFVDAILAEEPGAHVVVLGDLNDFEFSTPLQTLEGGVLSNLTDRLPQAERYTSVLDGNSQALDHILVTSPVLQRAPEYDIVHVNAEFADRAADRDPPVLRYAPASVPSAVEVHAFGATRAGRSVVLRWRTGSTARILAFDVYRERARRRVRLNRAPIAVRSGAAHAWRDRRPPARTGRYWLRAVRLDGTRAWWGPVQPR